VKKSTLIKGLTVFSISEGKEIGKVEDIIINAHKKAVDFFIVSNNKWFLGTGVIPFSNIIGIGEDAVMLEHSNAVKKPDEILGAIDLINEGVNLINNTVLTREGNFIGKVTEVIIEESSGRVSACEYSNIENEKKLITAAQMITFGQDALVVNIALNQEDDLISVPDVNEEKVLPSEEPAEAKSEIYTGVSPEAVKDESAAQIPTENDLQSSQPVPETDVVAESISPANTSPVNVLRPEVIKTELDKLGPAPVSETPKITPPMAEVNVPKESTEPLTAAQLFAQKQKEYLIGKISNKSIIDNDGAVLVNQGETLTEEIVDRVTKAGKFRELVLNV
jgi:uncharacterized protein YrrD